MGTGVRAVLDTNVVIATGVTDLPGELAVSTVTLAELHFGVLVAREAAARAERLRRLTVLQRRFDALPVDDAVVAAYGRLAAAVVGQGRSPRPRSLDLLIAATAMAHDAALYTRNVDDFVGAGELVELIPV